MVLDFRKQSLAQLMPLQQVAKVENGGLIGERLRQPQSGKAPHRLCLVQQVLHGRVAEAAAQLHDVHPQHNRQRIGSPATFPAELVRPDPLLQTLPGHQSLQPLQKFLPARLALPLTVFQVGECGLIHATFLLARSLLGSTQVSNIAHPFVQRLPKRVCDKLLTPFRHSRESGNPGVLTTRNRVRIKV